MASTRRRPTAAPPTHERVHGALRRRILGGEVAPGQPLTLRGLAGSLGVSVTPVREAVRRLIAERALETRGAGRIAIPSMTRARLEELTAARALLEPELAARALADVDKHLILRMTSIDATIDDHLAGGDAAAYVRANTEFHTALYARAGAPALTALVESVWLQTAPFMRLVYARLDTAGADHHKAALAALTALDETALRAAIRADVQQSAALMADSESLDGRAA